jgi:hypothetical protein
MADRKLTLQLVVDDAGTAKLQSFSNEITKTSKNVEGMSKSLSIIKWDAIVSLGQKAFQAAEQIYALGKSVASSLNDIQRQAGVLGLSTTSMQEWRYAAKMADVDSTALATGFKFLSRSMGEVATGTGDAAKYFTLMGISAKDSSGGLRPLNDVMKDIMDKFASWADGPEKIAVSLALFGRSGETLIPLLNRGSAGFDEFAKAAEKLGIIIDPTLIDAGSKLEDRFKNLEARMDAFKTKAIPVVDGMLNIAEAAISVFNAVMKADKAIRDFFQPPKKTTLAPSTGGGYMENYYKETVDLSKIKAQEDSLKHQKIQADAIAKAYEKMADEIYRMDGILPDSAYYMKIMEYQAEKMEKAFEESKKHWEDLHEKMLDSVSIMDKLGIKTGAGLKTQLDGLLDSWRKILSGPFTKNEMTSALDALKAKALEIRDAMKGDKGGRWEEQDVLVGKSFTGRFVDQWKGVYEKQMVWVEDITDNTWDKVADDMYQKTIDSFTKIRKEFEANPAQIYMNDSQVVEAMDYLQQTYQWLQKITAQQWKINLSIPAMPGQSSFEYVEMPGQSSFEYVDQNQVTESDLSYPSFAAGGYIPSTGLYKLHAGETVISKDNSNRSVNISIGTVQVTGNSGMAENLDSALADLWYKDRSRLKKAVMS